MAEQRMKVRDKKVQKMTKDGLVEENLTDKSSVRVSNRVGDVQMGRKQGEKEENLVDKSPRQSERSGKNIRPSVQKSRDAPELIRTEKQSEDLKPWETTGMVVLQAESEVASINMVYGGAGAGKRVLTTSSSPGVALMQEGLSRLQARSANEEPIATINVTYVVDRGNL